MKLRYMIEYAIRDRNTNPHYGPIGVWVQGPGPGLDLTIRYLPGNEDTQEEADWVINRLVEAGLRSLPDDFQEIIGPPCRQFEEGMERYRHPLGLAATSWKPVR